MMKVDNKDINVKIISDDIRDTGLSQFWVNGGFWTVVFDHDKKVYKATMKDSSRKITSKYLDLVLKFISM